MDRKICDGCGREITGLFTRITTARMMWDGQEERLGPTLLGEYTIIKYDLCTKCTPVTVLTKSFLNKLTEFGIKIKGSLFK